MQKLSWSPGVKVLPVATWWLSCRLEAAGYGVVGIGSHASAFLVDIQTGLNRQRFLEV